MAELLVGGAFLSTFLQVAFGRLVSKPVIDYFRRKKLDLHLLEKLKITMLSINKLIDDAEEKETTNRYVKQWLDELKNAVYDAEDVLDVISTVHHTYNMKTGVHRLTRKLRPSWNPFDLPINQELDNVFDKLQFLLQQKDVLGLKESNRSRSRLETPMRLPTTSIVEESGFYGRDVDKEHIKKLLLSNDGSIGDVIAIVGMGGLGKTTLAQFVFNDDEINRVFKLNKVWICVAEDFDVIRITKTILEKITLHSCDTNDFDRLQTKLKDILSGKKFLIVLDDIWNQDDRDWEILRKPLNFGAPGSKIIATTRSTIVANAMRAISTYNLQVLSDEDCWLLFAKHAFGNISPSLHSQFEVVGRKLVKKCRGLPLGARVLGGLLRTKVVDKEEWDEVLNNDIWNSSDEASENKILPVLRLSYHYLPSNLKQCFAFCSLIPKDYEFEREKIVLLWMAGSLLSDRGGMKKRRDIGYEYLGDLEARSLIQPCSERKSHFKMHDLVNDLATAVSGDFYKRCDIGNSFEVGEHTRHFLYVIPDKFEDNDLGRLEVISEAKRLRSLLALDNGWLPRALHFPSKILRPLKLIRTLILSKSFRKKLPSSIGNLKLLRYLDLSHNYRISHLPESLASLYNLEVLILKECRFLTKLPSKMKLLTKLNHLDIRHTTRLKEMPLQMVGSLKDLDVLTDFVVGKGSGSSIRELGELKYLRGELSIRGVKNITHPADALEANLKEKSYLEELTLKWDIDSSRYKARDIDSSRYEARDIGSANLEDARIILENLRPHVNLKKLYIERYSGTRLPDWVGDYSFVNLVDIEFNGFEHCFDLSPLGQLPFLETLTIRSCDSLVTLVGTEISAELPNEIHNPVGHFSALVRLSIIWCPKLELPRHHCFTSIEDLNLEGGSCASLQFFPLSLFPKLKTLRLLGISLESLAVIDEANNINLEYLKAIEIIFCRNFEYFDAGKWCAPRMTYLKLRECDSLKVLPENLCNLFPSLLSLDLIDCPNLEVLPQSGLPCNLSSLLIMGCNKLIANRSSWGLQRLLSLSFLSINNFECDDLESFPEEGLLPSSLSSLCINDVPNLRSLNGKSFQLLTSLDTLLLYSCLELQCLPELPTSLSTLKIAQCPLLESRCQREQGEDWSKIAHIPNIHVSSY